MCCGGGRAARFSILSGTAVATNIFPPPPCPRRRPAREATTRAPHPPAAVTMEGGGARAACRAKISAAAIPPPPPPSPLLPPTAPLARGGVPSTRHARAPFRCPKRWGRPGNPLAFGRWAPLGGAERGWWMKISKWKRGGVERGCGGGWSGCGGQDGAGRGLPIQEHPVRPNLAGRDGGTPGGGLARAAQSRESVDGCSTIADGAAYTKRDDSHLPPHTTPPVRLL